jgi:hypothetical protein
MKFAKAALLVFAVALLLTSASFADVLYTQAFDGTGNAFSSQNDTTGGFGLYAQVYDNFSVGSDSVMTDVHFTGEFFNPPDHGDITAFTVQIYSDAAGQPGSLLYSASVNGNGGEAFLGTFGGFPTYTYDIEGLNFNLSAGTTYWLSVYPDLGFPPQWGWSSGTGGDGISYQDFFGARSLLANDMAFDITGHSQTTTPEPSSMMLLGAGLLGLGRLIRRK